MPILGPLQLRVMPILWRENATVAQIHEELNGQPGAPRLAYTTILTVVSNLRRRKFCDVVAGKEGRSFVWRATVSREKYLRDMASFLLNSHFGGDAKALISLVGAL